MISAYEFSTDKGLKFFAGYILLFDIHYYKNHSLLAATDVREPRHGEASFYTQPNYGGVMFFVSSSYAIDDLSQHHGLNDGISSVKLGANTTVCFPFLFHIFMSKR
jgi:hypothetical protein